MQLNPEQQNAVTTVSGPVLVIAGAGSGKTRVLTNRVAYLIEQNFAKPENILAVTFTNKAADEMKTRIKAMLGAQFSSPWIGTFHAICVKVLRREAVHIGYTSEFSIYDTADQLQIIKETAKAQGVDTKKFSPNAILGHISSAKSSLIGPQGYQRFADNFFQEVVAKIYPVYQQTLAANNAFDFDDLIMKTVGLFEQNPAVLQKYQILFQFILVDEYQDTNPAQYKLIKLLAHKHQNICVVGDDAQSIYGFRGATIENILSFEKDYPQAKVIKLEQNYRSTKTILDASNTIIRLNRNQKSKNLWTENDQGEKIMIYQAMDEKEEAMWITLEIERLLKAKISAAEIAILYRTNAQSRTLEEYLLRGGIAYRIVGNVKFYDRKEIKDILAYLRVIFNPQDNISLKRIINVPKRGIGPKALDHIEFLATQQQLSVLNYLQKLPESELQNMGKGVIDFVRLVKNIYMESEKIVAEDLINEVLNQSGYLQMLDDGTMENEQRLENIKELVSLAKEFSDLEPGESLQRFLEKVALIEAQYKLEQAQDDQITLMTIHAAKGLEYEYVFICGMEEGIFPHSRSYLDPKEMEEERRLAYVALTRAKKQLFLTHSEIRTFFGTQNNNPVSRFIMDIPDSLKNYVSFRRDFMDAGLDSSWQTEDDSSRAVQIDLEVGDRVLHSYFGKGVITDLDDSTVVVSFADGSKELSLEYANLQKIA